MTQPNPSTALARVVADELARHGVSLAVISPGSRSAALAIAFDQHPDITTRVVLDERSAAFWALGHARATGRPTVVVATSNAVANHLLRWSSRRVDSASHSHLGRSSAGDAPGWR
jgi:2-succinyl-5-enolpyruvyl-6-hydroxy-3-cyclohexene-1-carboxylate synthase